MSSRAPRNYAELDSAPAYPLSRLYHENSKLTERSTELLVERIELFSGDTASAPREPHLYPSRPALSLPRANRRFFGARLDDTLRGRRSQRGRFSSRPLELTELGALLDLAVGAAGGGKGLETPRDAGQSEESPHRRPFPSAGGLYPVEVYVAALRCISVERKIHHYEASRHALTEVSPCPEMHDLQRLIFADDLWEGVSAILILTGVFERTQAKYGERGYRFVLLEAGHAAQNVLLAAQSMDLPAAPIGGFCEDALGTAMGLDIAKESPVYVVLLGGRSDKEKRQ